LARAEFEDDILLLEADLVFDDLLVTEMARMNGENVALVDRFQTDMDGTVILAEDGMTKSMVLKSGQGVGFNYLHAFKTVNIYRLTKESLLETIVPEMEEFLADGRADQYYEAVFANLIRSRRMDMAVMTTGARKWAEIDNLSDLRKAERMFTTAEVR
jgi:choline kinase